MYSRRSHSYDVSASLADLSLKDSTSGNWSSGHTNCRVPVDSDTVLLNLLSHTVGWVSVGSSVRLSHLKAL